MIQWLNSQSPCFVILFTGYYKTPIPAESGRDVYKGLE